MRCEPDRDAAHVPARPWTAPHAPAGGADGARSRTSSSGATSIDLHDLPQIVHHEGDAGAYLTAAISFAKDPASETWNCAYNRLMIKGRDTTSIHLTARQASLGVLQDRRGARGAAAGGVRHRRAPRYRAGRTRHRLDRRGRACHHGRPSRRAARAGEVRDLRRPGARPGRDGHRGGDPPGARARPRDPSASSPATVSASASGRCVKVKAITHRARRVVPGHHGGPPRSHAAVYHPHGGQPLSGRARHGAVGEGGARARPLHLLRLHRAAAARPGQERDPGGAGRRSLHEARGRGGPRRRRLRRPPGQLGHRHPLPARPRPHRDHPRARLGPRPVDQARTATRPSGAWTRRPSPRSPPTPRATGCRPRCAQRIDLKAFGL